MKENDTDKYLLIALLTIIVFMFFLIHSFVGDIRRLHKNGVFIYPKHIRI